MKLDLCPCLKLYFNDEMLSSGNNADSRLSQRLDMLRGRLTLLVFFFLIFVDAFIVCTQRVQHVLNALGV